jgi:hypothetical protein
MRKKTLREIVYEVVKNITCLPRRGPFNPHGNLNRIWKPEVRNEVGAKTANKPALVMHQPEQIEKTFLSYMGGHDGDQKYRHAPATSDRS